jgi:hypothetical protein
MTLSKIKPDLKFKMNLALYDAEIENKHSKLQISLEILIL